MIRVLLYLHFVTLIVVNIRCTYNITNALIILELNPKLFKLWSGSYRGKD